MLRRLRGARLALPAFLALAAAAVDPSPASGPEVDVPRLLRRVADRARALAQATNAPSFTFRKLSVYESLNGGGEVKRVREKVYEVTLTRGLTHNRLVAVDGRDLTPEESAELSTRERKWRDTYANGQGGSPLDRLDQLLNEKLFARYDFHPAGREPMRGHPCVVLEFQPRPGPLPEDRLIDRVLNLLHGRLWIAEDEDEIVRADVRTEGTLGLWGGLLGNLEDFQLHLERDRGAPGVWFNRHTEVRLRGRKLFTPMNIRLQEVGGEFRPL